MSLAENIPNDRRMILCVDFDGVVHSYERGWREGELYGTLVPGFFDWVERAEKTFKIVIYSSRSKDNVLRTRMQNWLDEREVEWREATGRPTYPLFRLQASAEKPAAFVTIDDRCVQFRGDWGGPELQPEVLRKFKAWNQR